MGAAEAQALFAGVGAVGIGTLFGLLRGLGERVMRALRLVAMVATLCVVFAHFLPEAWEVLGPIVLLGVLFGLVISALPEWFHRGDHAHAGPTQASRLAIELGYLAVLAHSFGDGLALRSGATAGASLSLGAALAVAAHSVPFVAWFVMTFEDALGRRQAIARACGLALATAVGVFVASHVFETWKSVEPWLLSVTAGLLLHLVFHQVRGDKFVIRPATPAPPSSDRVD